MGYFFRGKKGLAVRFMTVLVLGLLITLVLLVALGPAKGILAKIRNLLGSGLTGNEETTASALAVRCAVDSVAAGKINYYTCVQGIGGLNLLTISVKPIYSYGDAINYIKVATGGKGALTAEVILDAEDTARKIDAFFKGASNFITGLVVSDTGSNNQESGSGGSGNGNKNIVGYVFGSGGKSVVVVCGTPEDLKGVSYQINNYDAFFELKDKSDYGGDEFKCKIFGIKMPQKVEQLNIPSYIVPGIDGHVSFPGAMDPSRIIYYNSFPNGASKAWLIPSEANNLAWSIATACAIGVFLSPGFRKFIGGVADIGVGGKVLRIAIKLLGSEETEAEGEMLLKSAEEDNNILSRFIKRMGEKMTYSPVSEDALNDILTNEMTENNEFWGDVLKNLNPEEFGISQDKLDEQFSNTFKQCLKKGCDFDEFMENLKNNLKNIKGLEKNGEWSEAVDNAFSSAEEKNNGGLYSQMEDDYNKMKGIYDLIGKGANLWDISMWMRMRLLMKADIINALEETQKGILKANGYDIEEAMSALQKQGKLPEFADNLAKELKKSNILLTGGKPTMEYYKNFALAFKNRDFKRIAVFMVDRLASNRKSWGYALWMLDKHGYLNDAFFKKVGLPDGATEFLKQSFECWAISGREGSCVLTSAIFTGMWYTDLLKVKNLPSGDKNDLYVYMPFLGFLKFPNNPKWATKEIPLASEAMPYSVFLMPAGGGKPISFYLASPCYGDFVVYKPREDVNVVVTDYRFISQGGALFGGGICENVPGNDKMCGKVNNWKCEDLIDDFVRSISSVGSNLNDALDDVEKFAKDKYCMQYCRKEFCENVFSAILPPRQLFATNGNVFAHPRLVLYTLAILDTPSVVNYRPCEQYIFCKYKNSSSGECSFHVYSQCRAPISFDEGLPYSDVALYLPKKTYSIEYYDVGKGKLVSVEIKGGENNVEQVPQDMVKTCKIDKAPAPGVLQNIGHSLGGVDYFSISSSSSIFVKPANRFLGEKPKNDFCYYGKIGNNVDFKEAGIMIGAMTVDTLADAAAEIVSGGTISAAMPAIIAAERCATASAMTFLFAQLESSYYWPNNPDINNIFIS